MAIVTKGLSALSDGQWVFPPLAQERLVYHYQRCFAGDRPHLSDTVGDIAAAAAAGYGITFRLHIALGSETPPTDEVLERVNALLAEVAPGLRVERFD